MSSRPKLVTLISLAALAVTWGCGKPTQVTDQRIIIATALREFPKPITNPTEFGALQAHSKDLDGYASRDVINIVDKAVELKDFKALFGYSNYVSVSSKWKEFMPKIIQLSQSSDPDIRICSAPPIFVHSFHSESASKQRHKLLLDSNTKVRAIAQQLENSIQTVSDADWIVNPSNSNRR